MAATVDSLKQLVDKVVADTSAAIQRVQEDVDELKRRLASGQVIAQSDLDAVTAKLESVSSALKAIDPDPSFPAPPPTP